MYASLLREREREREMQWGSRKSLIEQAKEEVEILEYQHPNKFKSLKQDLRAFIAELESENMVLKQTTISTQESSSANKRKKIAFVGSIKRRCSKTDAVLERAQQCLHKIQHLKTSLC